VAGIGDGERDSRLSGFPEGDLAAADEQTTTVRVHGVNGVADEIIENLADLSVKALDGLRGQVAHLDVNVRVDEWAVIHGEDGFEELLTGDGGGIGGLLVEAKRLGGDGGDAAQLPLGGVEVLLQLGEVVRAACQVEQVGHGFQGVVDLMGGGGGEAADGGQLLGLQQHLGCVPLLGDIPGEKNDAVPGGIDLEAEPKVERSRVEGFKGAVDTLVHGALEMLLEGGAFVDGVGVGLPDDLARRSPFPYISSALGLT